MSRRALNPSSSRRVRRGLSAMAAALLALPLAVATVGCTEDEPIAECSIATEAADCGMRGLICDADACVSRPCVDSSVCGSRRVCFEGTCTPTECTRDGDCATGATCVGQICRDGSTSTSCTVNADCAQFGQVCNPITQMCVDDTTGGCTSDTDCTAPQRCHVPSGQCVAGCVQDTDCTDVTDYCDTTTGNCTAGCREGNCPTDQTCDLETRQCVGACTISECAALGQACDPDSGTCVDRTGKSICQTCDSIDDDCGGPGDRCRSLAGALVCTYLCDEANGDTDCPTGFRCQGLTSMVSTCVPDEGSACEGCLVTGCADGEVCNPTDTTCQAEVETCKSCAESFECGPGASCVDYQGRTRCLERCAADGTCAATGYTCSMATGFCEPDSGSCTNCMMDPSSCTAQQVLDEDRCACVDCITNDDCSGNKVCAQGSGECVAGMGSCTGPADCNNGVCYGANAEGPGVCVGCIASGDCAAGSYCDEATLTCQSCNCPVGDICEPDGTCTNPNSCSSDTDCVNNKGADYVCDMNSGLCFIPGECNPGDPTIAPCPSGMCGGGMLPVPLCTCDPLMQNCRTGETCVPDFMGGGFCG